MGNKIIKGKQRSKGAKALIRYGGQLSVFLIVLYAGKATSDACFDGVGLIEAAILGTLPFNPPANALWKRFWNRQIPIYGHWFFISVVLGGIVLKTCIHFHLLSKFFAKKAEATL
jgi:hypothetical protein